MINAYHTCSLTTHASSLAPAGPCPSLPAANQRSDRLAASLGVPSGSPPLQVRELLLYQQLHGIHVVRVHAQQFLLAPLLARRARRRGL